MTTAARFKSNPMRDYRMALHHTDLVQRIGWVRQLQGLAIEAQGPDASVGELCRILPRTQSRNAGTPEAKDGAQGVLAEVVGLKPDGGNPAQAASRLTRARLNRRRCMARAFKADLQKAILGAAKARVYRVAPGARLQAKTPAVSCMRADTSPKWCKVSPKLISSWVSFLK